MKHLAWCLAGHRARGQSRASPRVRDSVTEPVPPGVGGQALSRSRRFRTPAASGAAHTQKERLPDETQDTVKFECHCLSEIQI